MELSLLNGKNSFAPTLHWDILIFSLIGLRTGQHDQNYVPARLSDNIWGSSPFVYFRHQNRVQQICIFMKVTTQQSHSEDSRMQRWGSRPGFNYFAIEFSFFYYSQNYFCCCSYFKALSTPLSKDWQSYPVRWLLCPSLCLFDLLWTGISPSTF